MNSCIDLYSDCHELIKWLQKKTDILEQNNVQIQSQPNGFMRLALEGQQNSENGLFLHVWLPNLPSQRYIHTHVFHLTSRIIMGAIVNQVYEAVLAENGAYQIVSSRCTQEDCLIVNSLGRVNMELVKTQKLSAGSVYEVSKGEFHISSFSEANTPALTLIRKSEVEECNPLLAIPTCENIPKRAFSRKQIAQDFAWKTIRQLLNMVEA